MGFSFSACCSRFHDWPHHSPVCSPHDTAPRADSLDALECPMGKPKMPPEISGDVDPERRRKRDGFIACQRRALAVRGVSFEADHPALTISAVQHYLSSFPASQRAVLSLGFFSARHEEAFFIIHLRWHSPAMFCSITSMLLSKWRCRAKRQAL